MIELPDFTLLLGQFRSGLTTAMFMFLIASGLSLIFGVLKIINFAHGSFYMIGAYAAWHLVHYFVGNSLLGFGFAVLVAASQRDDVSLHTIAYRITASHDRPS